MKGQKTNLASPRTLRKREAKTKTESEPLSSRAYHQTRGGRHIVRPLDFKKGERIINGTVLKHWHAGLPSTPKISEWDVFLESRKALEALSPKNSPKKKMHSPTRHHQQQHQIKDHTPKTSTKATNDNHVGSKRKTESKKKGSEVENLGSPLRDNGWSTGEVFRLNQEFIKRTAENANFWPQIDKAFPGKTSKQCQENWESLFPSSKKRNPKKSEKNPDDKIGYRRKERSP